ncbi:hypothetical protein TPA0908_44300 [Micromonospora sp. AKA38]|nr:hypothetical protein TPA0908_44300 [Micromonospora sp. AKA38]
MAPAWPGTEMPYSTSVPMIRLTLIDLPAPLAVPVPVTSSVVGTSTVGGAPSRSETTDRGGAGVAPPRSGRSQRYWPVLLAVSMDRPASVPLPPETSVRM